MKKKLFICILSAVICLQACCVLAVSARESDQTADSGVWQKLQAVVAEYPDGSFFTGTGTSCSHSKYTTCYNCSILGAHPELAGKLTQAWTCVGFSRYVFYEVFGIDDYYCRSSCTVVSLQNARAGDLVRFSNHDAIFLYADGGSYYLYEANYTHGVVNQVSYASQPRSASEMSYATIYEAGNYDAVNAVVTTTAAPTAGVSVISTDTSVPTETTTKDDGIVVNKTDYIINGVNYGMTAGELISEVGSKVAGKLTVTDTTGKTVDSDTVLSTGMLLRAAASDASYEIAVSGDVDGDGVVTAADARLALRGAIAIDDSLNICQAEAACISGSSSVTAADARSILRLALGLN